MDSICGFDMSEEQSFITPKNVFFVCSGDRVIFYQSGCNVSTSFVQSTGRYLYITFTSDRGSQNSGFHLDWSYHPPQTSELPG